MQPPGRSFASVSRADGKLGELDEELARAAFAAGCAAAVRGDRDAAIPWLDRACRLSPGDRTYTLALATHSLASSPARAAILFASVTASDDVREAWVGLASARLHLGDAQQAAAALGHALSHHALMPGVEGLADAIAGSVGASGWCALATGGHLRISAAPAGAAIQIFLDGRAMPWAGRHEFGTDPEGLALPKSADAARCLAVRIGGREALGSPIVLAAIRGIEGVVDCRDGGLEGWAWHPGDPDREPVLHLTPHQAGAGSSSPCLATTPSSAPAPWRAPDASRCPPRRWPACEDRSRCRRRTGRRCWAARSTQRSRRAPFRPKRSAHRRRWGWCVGGVRWTL